MALGQSPTSKPLSTLPNTVPTDAEKVKKIIKSKEDAGHSEAGAIEVSSKGSDTMEENDDDPELTNKLIVDMHLDKLVQKSNQAIRKETITFAHYPRPIKIPSPMLTMATDGVLKLSVEMEPSKVTTRTKVVWVYDNAVVCEGLKCDLKILKPANNTSLLSMLRIYYINSFGSFFTTHKIMRTSPFLKSTEKDPIKTIDPVKFNLELYLDQFFTSESEYLVDTLRGFSVVSKGNDTHIIGQGIVGLKTYEGQMSVSKNSVVRIQGKNKFSYFGLSGSVFELRDPASVDLVKGGMRLRINQENKEPFKISTNEINLTLSSGSDVYIYRNALKRKDTKAGFFTRVVPMSKNITIEIKLRKDEKSKKMTLPPGVEIVIDSLGYVSELGKPNGKTIEKLIKLTLTPEEVAKLEREKEESKNLKLSTLFTEVKVAIEKEDFFEVQSILNPVQERFLEDQMVLYYLGLAAKNLYQTELAKSLLTQNLKSFPEHALTSYLLMLIAMEEEKWSEASGYLQKISPSDLPEDGLEELEFPYYSGVVSFKTGSYYRAKNDLTRCQWSEKLDSSLKQSASALLAEIAKLKSWQTVILSGGQWDPNPNSQTSAEIKANPPTKNTRLIVGSIYSYDPSAAAKEEGNVWGAGAKAIGIKNFPSVYGSRNALVAEMSVSQLFIGLPELDNPPYSPEEKDKAPKEPTAEEGKKKPAPSLQFKLTQSLAGTWVAGKPANQTFLFSLQKQKFNFGFSFVRDSLSKGKSNSFNMDQLLGFDVFAAGKWVLDWDFLMEQSFLVRRTKEAGNKLKLTTTPNLSYLFGPRLIGKLSLPVMGEQHLLATPEVVYKTNPTLGTVFFLTPGLMLLTSYNYEITKDISKSRVISKPQLTGMLVGIF